MTEPRIRAFAAGDLEPALALRARVFGATDLARERARWAWEHDANPFRDPTVPPAWVAEVGDELVGLYGLLPVRASLDGADVLALCGMDFCVDEAHRSRGLGLRLTKAFVDTPGPAYRFVTSPTPPAAALMRYYGARMIDARSEPALWVAAGTDGAEESERVEELAGDAASAGELDDLARRLARRHRVLVARGGRYFAWRWHAYPFADARPRVRALRAADGGLAGVAVFQHDPHLGHAYLAELLHEPDDLATCDALVGDALALARAAGSSALYLFHRGAAARPVLAARGLAPVLEHALAPLALLPPGPGLADWHVTGGDGDFLFGVGARVAP